MVLAIVLGQELAGHGGIVLAFFVYVQNVMLWILYQTFSPKEELRISSTTSLKRSTSLSHAGISAFIQPNVNYPYNVPLGYSGLRVPKSCLKIV